MKISHLVLIGIAALTVGCSSGDDAVKVPDAATQGGNVVNDPKLKEQLMGSSQAQPQTGLGR